MKIRILKDHFKKNDMEYKLIKRSDNVYMFKVGNNHIEVGKIMKRKKGDYLKGYDLIEKIPSNSIFKGNGKCLHISNMCRAEKYYYDLVLKFG